MQEEKRGREGQCFLEQNKQGLHKIYFHEVRYIETCGKSTLIHAGREEIPSSRQMKQFEQLFAGSALVRCHAGYIVNLRYFQRLEESMLVLGDGTRIPVSRSRRPQVLAQIELLYGEES